jgi:cell wall-associated NlpC family hydrolase
MRPARRASLPTLLLLAAVLAAPPAAAQVTAPSSVGGERVTAPSSSPPPARLGGAHVRALQRRVGVRADGVVGRRTAAALRRAERRLGLPVDGRPDPALLAALGLAPALAPTPPRAPARPTPEPVDVALALLGTPYGPSAAGPDAFDCSGLVQFAFARAGITLPRSSYAQATRGMPVPAAAIRRGDLVFFATAGAGPSDVGIATSPTTAVSATTRGVREHAIFDAYWGSHFVGARRVVAG